MHAKPTGFKRAQKTGQNLLPVNSGTFTVKVIRIKKMKRQATNRETIFSNVISDTKINKLNKNRQNLILQMSKRPE